MAVKLKIGDGMIGCQVDEEGHEVLNTFFDGIISDFQTSLVAVEDPKVETKDEETPKCKVPSGPSWQDRCHYLMRCLGSTIQDSASPKRGSSAGKRHYLATQLFQCCTAVFRLLQRSFW